MPVLDGHVSGQAWTVVIPVKRLTHAKSRLGETSLPTAALARAFVTDVLDAVGACAAVHEVIVATADPDVAELARACGAGVVDDAGHDGINAAVTAAVGTLDIVTAIAVLVSDLPRLTTAALDHALAAGQGHDTSFIADLAGTGTTLWMAESSTRMPPAFGSDSRRHHRAAGAVDLVDVLGADFSARVITARCDVDTPADLLDPRLPPLRPHTRALLEQTQARDGQ